MADQILQMRLRPPWHALLPLAFGCASREVRHDTATVSGEWTAGSGTSAWLPGAGDAAAPEAVAVTAEPDAVQRGRASRQAGAPAIEIVGGVGFTVGPGSLLVFGEADVPVARSSSIGPLVQIGLTDERVLFAPALHFRHEFALPPETGLRNVTPWVQVGGGLMYAYESLPRGSHDDVGPLLLVGGGAEWRISSQVSARCGLLLDLMPFKVLDEHLTVSVQLFALSFRL